MSEDFGIKAGTNLNTDSNLILKLTSADSSLKLYKWKDVQFTTDGLAVGSVEVPHDLGYVPIVQVYGKHDAQFPFLAATTYPNAYSLIDSANAYRPYGFGMEYFADADKITVRTIDPGIDVGALPLTTYHFRVLIWVDLSEDFTGSSQIALTDDFGFKISNKDKNVLTGKEYEMAYSSKYKAIQYYDNHVLHATLTLPEMWASIVDQEEEEAVYVDFNHNLGYPPMFFVYTDLGDVFMFEIPYSEINPVGPFHNGELELSAWCDSSRVRVLFRRKSIWLSGYYGHVFAAETVHVHVILFAENLAGTESP